MAITVGNDNVSARQESLLRYFRTNGSRSDLAGFLTDLVLDDGPIANGEETLHPDWILLYNEHREYLRRSLEGEGWPNFDELSNILDPLGMLDPLVSEIDPKKEKIAFLLGAGASKPHPSNIPTVKQLLPELLSRALRLDQEQVTSLVEFCNDQGIDDIEDLLTAAQISAFCSRNPRILSLVQFQLFGRNSVNRPRRNALRVPTRTDVSSVGYVQDTLQVLFGLLSNLMLPASPNAGHHAIAEYLRAKPSTPIITTNYDCCIDRALISNDIPFSYTMEFANPDVLTSPPDSDTSLIKLHGSLNWFYCETCQKVRLIHIDRTVDDYKNERGEYPIISVCNECGGQRRGLLVPPHAMKVDVAPPLQPLIAKADLGFEYSTLIVVIGFSFADADSYISRMIIKAMQESSDTRLVIIDPDPQVVQKVRRKFEAQIAKFDSRKRILKLQGDCAELLPRFLEGDLLKTPPSDADEEPVEGEGVLVSIDS